MQKRHQDRNQYFKEQAITTKKYVIPYVSDIDFYNNTRVLEIGCGEGGNLEPFVDIGCEVVGIDLRENSIKVGKEIYKDHQNGSNVTLIHEDIYNLSPYEIGTFDFIFMKDVIEHIHDQDRFMKFIKEFLKDDGRFFLGFPPWQMPFGGHQQICKSKFLSKLPYFHLLPTSLYNGILKIFGESERIREDLIEIKETGISIERFEKILDKESYKIQKRTFYFINPNYEVKFGLKPRVQSSFVAAIPWIRNYFTTCVYYVISS